MIGTNCFNVIKALVVRGALTLHTFLTVWRVTENLHDQKYWLLCLLMVPFIAETLYSIIRRKGREYLWFSPCFFLYLCATLPPIWLLELDKSRQVREDADRNTTSQISDVTTSATLNVTGTVDTTSDLVPLELNPSMWTIVIEEMLLYLLVIGRWILPRGEVTREQLSELLFAFIGIAADVMEFFSLFGEDAVRRDEVLGYLLLAIWSLSILQFTMAVTVTQQPKRAKKFKVVEKPSTKEDERRKMRNELLAIFVSMAMQDLPFLILRLYTIVTYNLVTYSLIFFTSKNALVISLLIYKVVVILQKNYCPTLEQQEEEDHDKGEKIMVGRRGDGESTRSVNSRYALDYEVIKGNKVNYSGDLTHRKNAPKLDREPHRSDGSGSSGTSSPPSTTRPQPNGQSMRQEKPSEMRPAAHNPPIASPDPSPTSPGSQSNSHHSASSPTESSSSESTSKSSDSSSEKTPSHTDSPKEGSSRTELSNSPREEGIPRTEVSILPKDEDNPRTEPIIYTTELQDAKPGDPDFKPYVSVLKI